METNPFQESLSTAKQQRQIDARLRHLDIDDLYLLSFLGDGKRLADAARGLSLSQPAITQRIHKIEQSLGMDILERSSRVTRLTEPGLQICRLSSQAMGCLHRFFDGRIPTQEAIAVTGAWAGWIVANALGRLAPQDGLIDVESITLETLAAAVRNQEGFGPIVATLHLVQSREKINGYTTAATIERPVTLWHASGLSLPKLAKPIPLIEVSREERLINAASAAKIEEDNPFVRGVRYAGTVAGAIQLASKGQGLLVAPHDSLEPGIDLEPALLRWKGDKAAFALMIDERAPIVGLVAQLIKALQ